MSPHDSYELYMDEERAAMQQLREQTVERHLFACRSGDCYLSTSKCIYFFRAFTVGEITSDVYSEHIMHYVQHVDLVTWHVH